MRRAIAGFIVALAALGMAPGRLHAQSFGAAPSLASPAPTLDHPRKIVMSLSTANVARQREIINNIANTQRYYGADYVRIALVVYGPGIHAVLKGDSKVPAQIEGLVSIGVQVLACNNTLRTIHRSPSDLLAGVGLVPNAIPAIVEREAAGWIYVRP